MPPASLSETLFHTQTHTHTHIMCVIGTTLSHNFSILISNLAVRMACNHNMPDAIDDTAQF